MAIKHKRPRPQVKQTDWVDPKYVASRVGFSERTIRNWNDRQMIPGGRKFGNKHRFLRKDVDKWFESSDSPLALAT